MSQPSINTNQYEQLASDVARIVATKQMVYGDSFGKSGAVMEILYPDGISQDDLPDALTIVRIVDKLFRIATDRDALGESPWQDIMGYSLLALHRQTAPKAHQFSAHAQDIIDE